WAGPGARGESRLERAAASASASVALALERGDAIEWVASVGGEEEVIAGRELPAEWLEPPRAPQSEPRWERLDRPGTMWVTDAAPLTGPRRAGVAASGGAAVPGPIASPGTLRLDWDGERIVESPEPADARRLAIDVEVPELLRELIRIWAKDRSIELAGDFAGASLVVTCARCSSGTVVPAKAGRDGWITSGEAAREGALDADPELGALEPWLSVDLAGGETAGVVTWTPGRIDIAWLDLHEVAGDPAAFAVSWSELLDAALLPAEGVVALSERLDAGPALVRAPAEPPEPAGWNERTLPPDALLAVLAAVLTLAALGLRA
ncbi:MAG TPA: hypothetical protein VMS76_18580, partial [Planctomycetota bacterium]|nr:hypothetical protein [Planctomycetota bacterium]